MNMRYPFAFVMLGLCSAAQATIIATGDVNPANPATWTSSTGVTVGRYGAGTLDITNGGTVSSSYVIIADYSGSTGVVTVDGLGSTWTSSNNVLVGYGGDGTLSITGGGATVLQHLCSTVRIQLRNGRSPGGATAEPPFPHVNVSRFGRLLIAFY